ncbi:MAG: NAD-dependent epimerase/dehydratase family protein, partial [Victivallaceae bacterium]
KPSDCNGGHSAVEQPHPASRKFGGRVRVGITGQSGFIGTNLCDFLGQQQDIERIPFAREYFTEEAVLQRFVSECDVIVHLAAISRHADGQLMYDTNMRLERQLIAAMEAMNVKPHVLFASTTHESKDSLYHASKRDGRRLLEEWSMRNGGKFTCMLMPNTFGPFGKPFYNSVVSTFCYQVANGETPEIMVDAPMQLIYINDLCREFYQVITGKITGGLCYPKHGAEKKVSEILATLQRLKPLCQSQSAPLRHSDEFENALFNTLKFYIDSSPNI